jgi:hypothetical protein
VQFIFLFGAMLIVMLLRVAMPIGARITGEPIGRLTLSFSERVRLQRTNVYAIGAVLLVCVATSPVPLIVELLVIVAVFAILAIPARYVITTHGIAFNRVVFRPWSDFVGYSVDSTGIRLIPQSGAGAFRLIVGPHRRDGAAKAIRRFLAPVDGNDAAARGPRRRGRWPTRTRERSRTTTSAPVLTFGLRRY